MNNENNYNQTQIKVKDFTFGSKIFIVLISSGKKKINALKLFILL